MKRLWPVTLCSLLGLVVGCTTAATERPSSSRPSATPVGHSSVQSATSVQPKATASGGTTTVADVLPADIARITPELARKKVQAGEAMLVCAYGDRSKCGGVKLEGSMAYADFAALLPELDKQREIILYCA